MNENKQINNKNGFLITCISCIVLLLVMLYFGINSSFKGTSACMDYQTCISTYSYCKLDDSGCYTGAQEGSGGVQKCPGGQYPDSYGMCVTCATGNIVNGICVYESSSPTPSCYSKSEAEQKGKDNCKNGNYIVENNQSNSGCWYYKCTEGSNPTHCDAGTYYKNGSCVQCLAGYYCPGGDYNTTNEGLVSCDGSFSKEGSDSPDDCEATCSGGTSWFETSAIATLAAENKCKAEGKNFYKAEQVNGNCYTLSCCNCTGNDCNEEYNACWKNGSTYVNGSSSVYGPNGLNYEKVDASFCVDKDYPTSPGGGNPGNPSNPGTGGNPNNPSSGNPNVPENPQTSDILIFIVWVVGLFSICYSLWYYKKVKNNQ